IKQELQGVLGPDVTPVLYIGDPAQIGQPDSTVPSFGDDNGTFSFSIDVQSLKDGKFQPVDLGPITLGLLNVHAGGLTFGGQITLGGYQGGVWNPDLSGFFEITSSPDHPEFLNLRLDIKPGSTLTFDNNGASLKVLAEVALDAGG